MNLENLTVELEKKLEKAEKELVKFKEISDKMIAESGLSKQEIQKQMQTEELTPEALHLLKRSEQLAFEAQKLGGSTPEGMLSDPRAKQKKGQDSAKERRKKFKRFGSDKNWRPM